MPEGPDVKQTTDFLRAKLQNAKFLNIEGKPGYFPEFISDINKLAEKCVILDVQCKGKFIYFILRNNERTIYIGNHLGLAGHWSDISGGTTKLILKAGDIKLYYNDRINLGHFWLLTEDELVEKLSELGPDVLDSDFSLKIFQTVMNNPKYHKKVIADLLIDQHIISGIGNYLRAEILYRSRIHPLTMVSNINPEEILVLYKAITDISLKCYENKYEMCVYGNKTDPLNNLVEKIILKGRNVFYVPKLQQLRTLG